MIIMDALGELSQSYQYDNVFTPSMIADSNHATGSFFTSIPLIPSEPTNEIPTGLLTILTKQYQQRSSLEQTFLRKYLRSRQIFKEIAQHLSEDVMREWAKRGKVTLLGEGECVCVMGQRVKALNILLIGEVGLLQHNEDPQEKDLWKTLNKTVNSIGKKGRARRGSALGHHSSMIRRSATAVDPQYEQLVPALGKEYLSVTEPECFLDWQAFESSEPRHTRTLMVSKSSVVVRLEMNHLIDIMLGQYARRMVGLIGLLRRVGVFSPFEDGQLRMFLDRIEPIELKKGDTLYKEGDPSQYFYILTEGEVEISRKIQIFQQNPNSLYKSRLGLGQNGVEALPYANFNSVYNYQPSQCNVVLSLVRPVALLGEEEVVAGTDRQVTAKTTTPSTLYPITLAQVEDLCGSGAEDKKMSLVEFFTLLEQSVTLKKILLRQNQLSEMVLHNNKSHYSTLFSAERPKRSRQQSRNHTRSTGKKLSVVSREQENIVPPTFNHFNFNEFMGEEEKASRALLTDSERKVMRFTHQKVSETAKNDKNIRFRHYSRHHMRQKEVSMTKATIETTEAGEMPLQTLNSTIDVLQEDPRNSKTVTIDQPLFDLEHFNQLKRREVRLESQIKKKKMEEIYRRSASAGSRGTTRRSLSQTKWSRWK